MATNVLVLLDKDVKSHFSKHKEINQNMYIKNISARKAREKKTAGTVFFALIKTIPTPLGTF